MSPLPRTPPLRTTSLLFASLRHHAPSRPLSPHSSSPSLNATAPLTSTCPPPRPGPPPPPDGARARDEGLGLAGPRALVGKSAVGPKTLLVADRKSSQVQGSRNAVRSAGEMAGWRSGRTMHFQPLIKPGQNDCESDRKTERLRLPLGPYRVWARWRAMTTWQGVPGTCRGRLQNYTPMIC